MTDPNLYRFVEVNVIEQLRADIQRLLNETDSLKARADSLEQKLWKHEEYANRHENYDYRISIIIITPESSHDRPIGVDETFYVKNAAEAEAKEKEIFERQQQLKRKVMVCSQTGIRPAPF